MSGSRTFSGAPAGGAETPSGAQTKATAAQTAAISAAATDATTKVAAEAALRVSGDAASVSTAAADATTKANAAQTAAATDATAKVATETTARAAADALLAPLTRSIATTAPLTGGGDLSANRTIAISNATTGAVGAIQLAGDLAGTGTAPVVAAGAINAAKAPFAAVRLTTTATKTGAFTAAADQLIPCDATAGAIAGALPSAATAGYGAVIVVKKIDSTTNPVTMTRAGSDTINAAGTSVTLSLPDEALTLTSDGTSKWTISAGQKTLSSLDARLVKRGELFIDPRDATYGAVADGVADDTAAITAAFTAANALTRAGVVSTIRHPGATVLLKGRFNLATLATAIPIQCNVVTTGSEFIVPAAYAGTAVFVGHATSGSILQNAQIALPDVMKPTGSAIVAGSIAVQVQNLYNSDLICGRNGYFETGEHFTGLGNGTVYNRIHIGTLFYSKVALKLKPKTGGWVNQNTFSGGGIQQSAGFFGGTRLSGYRHLEIDGAGITGVDGNNFYGISFEGDVSDNCFYVHHASNNKFDGCRFEAGTAFTSVTVSGASLTATAHGLVVGDMIVPTYSGSLPTGMAAVTPYYVVSVADANTFSISRDKGGTPITFSTAGSGVIYARPHRIYFDTSGTGVVANTIVDPVNPLGWLDIVHSSAVVTSNNLETPAYRIANHYSPEDLPYYRARNASSTSAVVRPLYAAYAPTVNPYEAPSSWATALSDRGLLWTGGKRLLVDSGGLKYDDGVTTETVAFSSGAYFGPRAWIAGHYHTPSNVTVTPIAQTAGNAYAVPIWVPVATTVLRIAVQVTTASAGSTMELALYSSDTTDRPVTQVATYGTVDTSTTGFKEITISQALTRGWYWAACLTLGGTPTVYANSAGHFMVSSPNGSLASGLNGFFLSALSALPAPWPSYAGVGFSPILAVRS